MHQHMIIERSSLPGIIFLFLCVEYYCLYGGTKQNDELFILLFLLILFKIRQCQHAVTFQTNLLNEVQRINDSFPVMRLLRDTSIDCFRPGLLLYLLLLYSI